MKKVTVEHIDAKTVVITTYGDYIKSAEKRTANTVLIELEGRDT